jgi:hypothetical protein
MMYMDNIGLEQKDNEYKAFMFNPLKISQEDSLEYLKNLKFVFDNSVIETIKNYFEIYLPKYICSYINPISNLDKGCLYFGISDDGSVSGIPYQGFTIPLEIINSQMDKIFSKFLKFPDEQIKNKIRDLISIEVIPVDISNHLTNKENYKTNIIYENYIGELNIIKQNNILYEKKRKIWNKMSDTYILKLCDMINDQDTRKIIWTYIKEKSNYSKKYFRNKYSHLEKYCDVDDYWNLMSKINSDHKFNPLKPKEIVNVKDNSLNIYFWTTMWKDSKISMLKLAKPKLPKKTIDNNYPIFLLSQSTKMIPYWFSNNPDLNLFVIKITANTINKYTIEYKDIENQWKKSYRTIKNGEPMSLTYT